MVAQTPLDTISLLQQISANTGTGGTPVSPTNPLPVSQGAVAKQTPTTPTTSIATGGTSQTLFAAGSLAIMGIVQNPFSATESLFLSAVGAATTSPNAGTFELKAGQSFVCYPSTLAWTVNAATTGHTFSAVSL